MDGLNAIQRKYLKDTPFGKELGEKRKRETPKKASPSPFNAIQRKYLEEAPDPEDRAGTT